MTATGAEIASAYVALTVKAPGLKRDIGKELGAVDTGSYGSQMGSKLAEGMKKSLKAAGVGVAAVLGTALVKGFGRLKAIETAQAKMRGLGHDSKIVALAMDNSLASVKGTAFGLGDAATAAGQLMAANIKPGKELEGVLKTVGNNASAAGVGFDEMGSIFAKAASQANGIQNDVLGQLADKGIPIYQALGDQMGVTAGEVFKLAQSGKINFDTFSAAAAAAAGTVAKEMGNTTTGAFDNMMAALGRLGAKILEDIFPLIGPLFQDVTKWLDEATTHVEPLVSAFGSWLSDSVAWLKENGELLKSTATWVAGLVAAYLTIRGAIAVVNGVRAALGVARAVQLGWNAATYGAAAASYASAGAAKVGLVAHKAWNVVVSIGKGLWALMNGSLIKSAALWVANTAKLVAHKVAVIANNAGLSLWLQLAAAQIAAGARSVATWVAGTAAVVGQKAALVASTVATQAAAAAQWLFNAAMNANPIGLIITAIVALVGGLIWFFTQTEIGQQIWANFTQFLTEAWANIVSVFSSATEWVINTAVSWGASISAWWTGLWAGIGSFFSNLWAAVKLAFWAATLWVLTTALNWALKVNSWWTGLWTSVGSFFSEKLDALKLGFRIAIDWLLRTGKSWSDGFSSWWRGLWDGLGKFFGEIWAGVKGTFQTLLEWFSTKPVEAFVAARDAIGDAWAGIQALAKKPVRFVIETVINGLINTINKIPGVDIPNVPLPKGFRVGGYTGDVGVNTAAGVVHGQEFVTRAESTAKIMRNHPGVLEYMNRHGEIPGYRKGGLVNPLPMGSYSVSQPYHGGHNGIDLAAAAGTKVYAAADGVVGLAGVVPMGGNEVYVQHTNGLGTRYSHLSRFATLPGTQVKAGNVIGYVGSTGMSTGPHLHYMVHAPGGGAGNYGAHVNPAPYLGIAGKDLGEAGGAQSILDGLVDFAASKVKGAFPEGGMWIDIAAGLAKNAAETMAKVFNPFAASDGHTLLYDNGGWLQPGRSLVENKTRGPEPILTGSQWADISRLAARGTDGGGDGPAVFHLYDTDGVLFGTIDGRIEAATSGASARALNDALGTVRR